MVRTRRLIIKDHNKGSEREKAKRAVRKEISEADTNSRLAIAKELMFEAEVKQASECWGREQADPINYKCTCPKLKIEDFLD